MKRIISIFILILLSFISNLYGQKQVKPNVLFIAIDDLKPVLGCYGDTIIKTPNIDRLAKMGTVFMSNYCQQAVCGPTRASIMTGTRPDLTKVWDLKTQMREANPATLTLPEYLITQGYTTVGIGKIYHASCAIDRVDPMSWSIPYLKSSDKDFANGLGKPANEQYQFAATKAIFSKEAKSKKNDDGDDETAASRKGPSTECIDVPDNAYEDGVNALIARDELINLSKSNGPFFFAVGLHKPHMPFVAPKKYWDLYKRDDMPLAKFQEHSTNGPLIAYHRSGELRNYSDIPEFTTLPENLLRIGLKPEKQRELIHGYYAAVSYTDAQVGILLNTLDSLGILNNTIIVLWGDHGWHLGDHDLWNKHTNFEQATRSPLIIAAPGYQPGKTSSLTEHLDIFSTICNLAGVAIPSRVEGKSLVPLMRNKKATIKEFSVSQYPRKLKKEEAAKMGYTETKLMGYAIRNERYRFVIWMNDFTSKDAFQSKKVYATELYDYQKDPNETVNVVNDALYKTVAKEMHQKMIDFFTAQEKNK